MFDFTQITLLIGRQNPSTNTIDLLGTGFLVKDSIIVTARHVVSDNDTNLLVILPHIPNINIYQDVSDTHCEAVSAKIEEVNPITDLCTLRADIKFNGTLPPLDSVDNINVGDRIGIFGFPHCVTGRRVLTYQETEIGAKMLLESSGIKSKYATINIQTRPGQSGSPVLNLKNAHIIGLIIGVFAPASGVFIAGVNPLELNQTSYCISADHIKELL
jgi:V8-like Glu-specific endopeptidase